MAEEEITSFRTQEGEGGGGDGEWAAIEISSFCPCLPGRLLEPLIPTATYGPFLRVLLKKEEEEEKAEMGDAGEKNRCYAGAVDALREEAPHNLPACLRERSGSNNDDATLLLLRYHSFFSNPLFKSV